MEKCFDDISISTQTIIGKTNWKINTPELFANLPVVEYTVIPKKRGRRPKDDKKVEPQQLNDGEIITLKLGDKIRGVDLKSKKKSKGNYFRNSLTIVMYCEDKLINFKVSKNGKFQFTGCKNDEHSHKCLEYVRQYISLTDKKILVLPINSKLEVVYITVMSNINSNLGFCINKENLDDYVNKNTEYYSLLETTFGYTGVNIKMNLPTIDMIPIIKMTYDEGKWVRQNLTYSNYISLLDEKDKNKERNKTRFNTFLVFQSGNYILSSPHKECMREAYHEFLSLVKRCRSFIEEKIEEKKEDK